MRTGYSGSDLTSSARASAEALSPLMPSARAAMALTKEDLSFRARRSDFRSAESMIFCSSATRSFQPLSKFSSLGGNFRSRYFSRGDCAHAVADRASRPASTSKGGLSPGTGRFMVHPTSTAPRDGSSLFPKALAHAAEDAAPRDLHHIKGRKALDDKARAFLVVVTSP